MSTIEFYTLRSDPKTIINMGVANGSVNIKGNLTVANVLTISGNLSIPGNLSVGNNLTVNNNATISNNLTVANNISGSANITTSGNGIGYTSGGNITQTSSKSGSVVLNKPTGTITMNAATLNAATVVSFSLSNTTIGANDHVLASHVSGGTLGAYGVTASTAANASTIYVRNNSASNLSEAIVLRFTVLKSSNG